MQKSLFSLLLLVVSQLFTSQSAQAHCQIPCGIYDDHARVQALLEDAATIEKSVSLITQLSGKTDAQSQNQLVRWVLNKEQHAQKIISSLSDYFLTQRIKPSQKDYAERLQKHHAVILAAMKTKQTADMSAVNSLKQRIEAMGVYYPKHEH